MEKSKATSTSRTTKTNIKLSFAFLLYIILLTTSTLFKQANAQEQEQEQEQGEDDHQEESLTRDALTILSQCGLDDFTLCFKERALQYLEQLPNDIEVGGLTIKASPGNVNENANRGGRKLYAAEELPQESEAREQAVDSMLVERVLDYLSSHTFQFKVPSQTVQEFKRSLEEEGRKKKKKNGMPMMMLFQLKAITLGAIALKAVALLALKALIVGKLALMIAGIIALKKLFEQKHHTSTYEVVAHPHFEEHGHYDRSFSQELAYKGHEQKLKTAY